MAAASLSVLCDHSPWLWHVGSLLLRAIWSCLTLQQSSLINFCRGFGLFDSKMQTPSVRFCCLHIMTEYPADNVIVPEVFLSEREDSSLMQPHPHLLRYVSTAGSRSFPQVMLHACFGLSSPSLSSFPLSPKMHSNTQANTLMFTFSHTQMVSWRCIAIRSAKSRGCSALCLL